MEKILENLVNDSEETNSSTMDDPTTASLVSVNNGTRLTTSSTNPRLETALSEEKGVSSTVEEEMDDVMNVLKDLNDVASGTFATNTNAEVAKPSTDTEVPHNVVDSLTSVQDVAKVVDFSKSCINDNSTIPQISASQAAEEQFAKLNARQAELEKRFANITTQVNQMRCRNFGSHVVDELTHLRSFYEKKQPQLQGSQSLNSSNLSVCDTTRIVSAQIHKSSTILGGSSGIQLPVLPNTLRIGGRTLPPDGIALPNTPLQINSHSGTSQTMPSGITLPSIGQIRSAPSLPTTPLAQSDIDSSTQNFTPRASLKSGVSGINITSPFSGENVTICNTPQSAPPKKIKVEKTKRIKSVKDRLVDTNAFEDEQKYTIKPDLPTEEESEVMKDGLNHLEANLRHLIHSYDSEATESSSGGESCDEFDSFSDTSYQQNQRDRESKLYQRLKSQQSSHMGMLTQAKAKTMNQPSQASPLIKHRAKWAWLSNRAIIGSKWTWLTAQISDLEYRIRQQNDLVRQIRALKGPVTLGDPVVLSTLTESSTGKTNTLNIHEENEKSTKLNKETSREYTELFDSSGRKIIIREPISPLNKDKFSEKIIDNDFKKGTAIPTDKQKQGDLGQSGALCTSKRMANEGSRLSPFVSGSCRTRPLKQLRRRCILPTKGLYGSSARAAKESTVRCDCIHPLYSCAICFGRSNHTQAPDPVFQDRARTISLLDHSYHQVLSNSKYDVPLELLIMQRLKNRSWMTVAAGGSKDQDNLASGSESKREIMTEKERRKEERRLKKLAAKSAAIASGQMEDTKTKNRKKYAAAKRRKLERELELELEEEGLITSEITAEELKAMLEERRKKLEAKKAAKMSGNNKRRNSEGSNKEAKRKRLRMLANNDKIRRKSVTVHHHADGNIHAMTDLGENGDDFDEIEASSVTSSSLPSPSVHGIHQLPTMEQIRRKRETAFDIDNIVIPYSLMASGRVEKLKYKEIQTPVWRIIDEEIDSIMYEPEKSNSITDIIHVKSEGDVENEDSIYGTKNEIHAKKGTEDASEEQNELKAEESQHGANPLIKHKSLESSTLIEGIIRLDEISDLKLTEKPSVVDAKVSDKELEDYGTEQTPFKSAMNPPMISIEKEPDISGSSDRKENINPEHDDTQSDSANSQTFLKESDDVEDISDTLYESRHAKAEIEEQIRWRTPLWKSSGGQRAVHRSFSTASSTGVRETRDSSNVAALSGNLNLGDGSQIKNILGSKSGISLGGPRTNQRQDSRSSTADKGKSYEAGSLSSGCNTPDPLSPSMVEKVDTLEVNTRPSTPTDNTTQLHTDGSVAANLAASIKNRRRTSSATRSRDRNPSEDASISATSTAAHSRCTTPIDQHPVNIVRTTSHVSGSGGGSWSSSIGVHNQSTPSFYRSSVEIRPFEDRDFPLSEDIYDFMLNEDQKEAHQLSRFSSKVEVISETTLIAGTVALTPGAVNDDENPGIFSALRGANAGNDHQSHIRGNLSSANHRYNVRASSGRFTSRSGGNSRSSSVDNTSQDGDDGEDYELKMHNASELRQIKGTISRNEELDEHETRGLSDDENDVEENILEENDEDEDPDWSRAVINDDDEEEDEEDEDLDDADDPEWGPNKEETKSDGKCNQGDVVNKGEKIVASNDKRQFLPLSESSNSGSSKSDSKNETTRKRKASSSSPSNTKQKH